MISSDKSSVRIVLQKCIQAGMQTVVCSPGSRNAPIVIAADEHPNLETLVIHDERVAAFYALGISLATGRPVGITCTSGSALLNYYPAVAEAYYQCVPLVVLSADRPEEWVNHGDGQTIVQKGVYTNHVQGELNVPEDINAEDPLVSELESLLKNSVTGWKGPVHINLPFNEPLYNTVEIPDVKDSVLPVVESKLDRSELSELISDWKGANRIMVLVGQMEKDGYVETLINDLSTDPSICVLVENTSNISGQRISHCIDRSLNVIPMNSVDEYKPDLLITIGGAVISKRIKSFLRGVEGLKHYRIGYDFPEMDTYRNLTKHISSAPSDILNILKGDDLRKYDSNFGSKWKQLDFIVKDQQDEYLDQISFSDLKVFHYLNQFMPEGSNLHMSNSSVVRYCQLFDPIRAVNYYCNRGTSGIDGSTSTALGVALKTPQKLNILVTGDVSFFYDSNALWTSHLNGNVRIILVNNSGGGIFRIIDGPANTSQLEKYFEAKHSHSAEFVCRAFDVEYISVEDERSFEEKLIKFLQDPGTDRPKLLEVKTDNLKNDKVLKKYFSDAQSWL